MCFKISISSIFSNDELSLCENSSLFLASDSGAYWTNGYIVEMFESRPNAQQIINTKIISHILLTSEPYYWSGCRVDDLRKKKCLGFISNKTIKKDWCELEDFE